MDDHVEIVVEFTDDDWDESQAGWREIVQVVYVDGVEVARQPIDEPGWYEPPEHDKLTSDETQSEIDELALRRADALGQPVIVAGFSSAGVGEGSDVVRDDAGELRLVSFGRVPFTPSPPPRVLRWLPRLARGARDSARPRSTRTRSRPRERRARATSSASRDGPSSEPSDIDPPPRHRLARWLRRLGRAV